MSDSCHHKVGASAKEPSGLMTFASEILSPTISNLSDVSHSGDVDMKSPESFLSSAREFMLRLDSCCRSFTSATILFFAGDEIIQPASKAAYSGVIKDTLQPSPKAVILPARRSEDEANSILSRLRNLDFMSSKTLVQPNRSTQGLSKF